MNFSDLHRRRRLLAKFAQVDAYQQKTQWSCSAGTLKAVAKHHGVDISEEEAVKAVGACKGRGAETTDIVEGARKLGFDAWEGSFPTLESVKKVLKQGNPIIADIQSFNYPGKGHYVVIAGHKAGKGFIVMDPNTKGKTAVPNWRVLSDKEMKKRWWDHRMAPPHEVMPRWGIVVAPKKEKTAELYTARELAKIFADRIKEAAEKAAVVQPPPPPKPMKMPNMGEGTVSAVGGVQTPKLQSKLPSFQQIRGGEALRRGFQDPGWRRRMELAYRNAKITGEKVDLSKVATGTKCVVRAKSKSYKAATGDILGMAAMRRAKAESARHNFLAKMSKVEKQASLEAAIMGGKIGGTMGAVHGAMKDDQALGMEKMRQIARGLGWGAGIGALIALGIARRGAGKTTLPRFWEKTPQKKPILGRLGLR